MIGYENTMGTVEISQEYFANLIGMAASECYGVAGMINSTYQGLRYAITRSDVPDKGVRVKTTDGKLIVDIHIAVTYGVNISAIAYQLVEVPLPFVIEGIGNHSFADHIHIIGFVPHQKIHRREPVLPNLGEYFRTLPVCLRKSLCHIYLLSKR